MDWAKLKVTELKAELKKRGLPVHGLKAELVERLTNADAEQAQGSTEDGAPETAPDANGDASAIDQPPAEPSGGDGDYGEEMKPAEETRENEADDDVASERQNEAQPVPASSPPKAADGQSQSAVAKAGEPEPEPESESRGQSQDAPSAVADTPMEETAAAIASQDVHAPSAEKRVEEVTDVARDLQKRKRSPSPTPPDLGDRKRQRGDTEEDVTMKPATNADEPREGTRDADTAMEDKPRGSSPDRIPREDAQLSTTAEPAAAASAPETAAAPQTAHPATETRHFPGIERSSHAAPETAEEMDLERTVDPAIHPATSALYIRNFMRPLRVPDVQAHLVHLANPSGTETAADEVEEFFLDQIRTHAFAVFKSVSAASRVRTALHNRVWPDEANRRPLWVDFVPAEKVPGWIETEESQGGSRSSTAKRWAVIYDDSGSGEVVARLELDEAPARAPTGPSNRGPAPPPARQPPRGPAFNSTNTIPLGPRAQRGYEGPPSRPIAPPGREQAREPGGKFGTTSGARPYVTFRLVSDELARQRLDDMHSYYTKDSRRNLGKEINRYTFEDGSRFVDRGAEVFEGIRPPHRERERQFERRGRGGRGGGRGGPRFGGRGPPGFQGSDRYLPGARGRDDRRRYDDSPPRHRGGRWEDDYRKDTGRLHFEDDREARDDYRNDRDSRY